MLRSRGSAPIDFILVSVPLLLLSLSILGISIVGYAKNIAQDVAIEAARYAALADQSTESGQLRGLTAIRTELGAMFNPQVSAHLDETGEGCSVTVTVELKIPRLGVLSSAAPIMESGHAICELQ